MSGPGAQGAGQTVGVIVRGVRGARGEPSLLQKAGQSLARLWGRVLQDPAARPLQGSCVARSLGGVALRVGGGRVEVVAGERHGLLPAGKLDLKDALPVVAERVFAGLEVVAPHPAEAVVVERAGAVLVRGEAVVPVAQRLGVMQAPDLDVGGVEVSALLDGWPDSRRSAGRNAGKMYFLIQGRGPGWRGASYGVRIARAVRVRRSAGRSSNYSLGVIGHTDMLELPMALETLPGPTAAPRRG